MAVNHDAGQITMQYEPFDWYQTPLYYDIIFDADTTREVAFLETVLSKYVTSTSGKRRWHILEPACGSGRLMKALEDCGHRTAGVDLAQPMLDFARHRGVEGKLLHAPIQDFQWSGPKFDLAHNLVSSFKYLLTEKNAAAHLQCVAETLRPGGVYVLGLHLTEYDNPRISHERWVGERDGVEVVCNIRGWPADAKKRREKVRSRLIVRKASTVKRYETCWQFRTYDAAQLRRLLQRVPALKHQATFNFEYDIQDPQTLGETYLDQVLILQKKPTA